MNALLATPQGQPTPLTVGVSHAIVGVAGFNYLGSPTTGLAVGIGLVLLHAPLDAALADALVAAAC